MKLENKGLENTEGVARDTLERTQAAFGMIPNMYAQMAHNASLLDAYKYSYDSFREHSGFTPEEQEVIFLAISFINECKYCMAAHSTVADLNHLDPELISDLRKGRQLSDDKLEALRRLTSLLVSNRGKVTSEEIDAFSQTGYDETHIAGIITAIGVKTFSNYFNHVFSPELDDVFAARVWENSTNPIGIN